MNLPTVEDRLRRRNIIIEIETFEPSHKHRNTSGSTRSVKIIIIRGLGEDEAMGRTTECELSGEVRLLFFCYCCNCDYNYYFFCIVT